MKTLCGSYSVGSGDLPPYPTSLVLGEGLSLSAAHGRGWKEGGDDRRALLVFPHTKVQADKGLPALGEAEPGRDQAHGDTLPVQGPAGSGGCGQTGKPALGGEWTACLCPRYSGTKCHICISESNLAWLRAQPSPSISYKKPGHPQS